MIKLFFIAAGICLVAPIKNFAQAANLGTASNFVVFTSVGAVTNTGASTITGDVGTNNGAITGFSSINGTFHNADGVTANSVGDLQAAYNQLTNTAATVTDHGVGLGNGETLNAGVYSISAATSLVGKLTLDGQGNSSSVFIFKIAGAFSASSGQLNLINGAQPCHIFWAIAGAADLTGTLIQGNIIATGAIHLTGGNLFGRALSISGSINTNAVNANLPTSCSNTLPVTWLYFRGKSIHEKVLLEWGTTDEKNNNFFTIEKSTDGKLFEVLSIVNARKDVAVQEHYYSFVDEQPYSVSYYRISQTDDSGEKNYFRTIEVSTHSGTKVVQYVQESSIFVQISDAASGTGFIQLVSVDGRTMFSEKITLSKEQTIYKIDRPVQSGIYILHIESGGEKLYAGKVMTVLE